MTKHFRENKALRWELILQLVMMLVLQRKSKASQSVNEEDINSYCSWIGFLEEETKGNRRYTDRSVGWEGKGWKLCYEATGFVASRVGRLMERSVDHRWRK